MSDVALLNPQVDLEGAARLLGLARDALSDQESVLTNLVMKQEDYLQAIGAATALRRLLQLQQEEYQRMVNR